MKKKKFRRDTRFLTMFFFKEKHSYTLQELSGDPQFWHPWKARLYCETWWESLA